MDRKRLLMAGAAAFVLALGAPQAFAQDVEAETGFKAETQVSPQVPGADAQTSGEMGAGTEIGEEFAPQTGAEADLDANTQVSPQVPSAEAETGEMGAGAELGEEFAPQTGAEADLDADTQVSPQVPGVHAGTGDMGAGLKPEPTCNSASRLTANGTGGASMRRPFAFALQSCH